MPDVTRRGTSREARVRRSSSVAGRDGARVGALVAHPAAKSHPSPIRSTNIRRMQARILRPPVPHQRAFRAR